MMSTRERLNLASHHNEVKCGTTRPPHGHHTEVKSGVALTLGLYD